MTTVMAAMTRLLISCCQYEPAGEGVDVVVEMPGVGQSSGIVADAQPVVRKPPRNA